MNKQQPLKFSKINLSDLIDISSIKKQVLKVPQTKEICGFINNKKLEVVPNDSLIPENSFLISKMKKATIFHTHWHSEHHSNLTFADIQLSLKTSNPIMVYHTLYDNWDYFDPDFPHPYPLKCKPDSDSSQIEWYLEQEYQYGRSDCYSIIVDWYKGYLNQVIPRGERYLTDLTATIDSQWNRFEDELEKLGGWKYKVGGLEIGDLVLFRINRRLSNHCGVVVELLPNNDAKILHQFGGKRTSELISFQDLYPVCTGVYSR